MDKPFKPIRQKTRKSAIELDLEKHWLVLRKQWLESAGRWGEWRKDIGLDRAQHGKSGWQERDRVLELKYGRELASARVALEEHRVKLVNAHEVEERRKNAAYQQERRQREREKQKPAPAADLPPVETGSGPDLLADFPEHWPIGGTPEFTKSDISWAIHHLHLPVEARQCPTPAAWNLLQIGRDDPREFMAKWGALALPKKDTEETEKRLDDDCLDLLTDLRVELARMQQVALVGATA